jgi:hypothetical protein
MRVSLNLNIQFLYFIIIFFFFYHDCISEPELLPPRIYFIITITATITTIDPQILITIVCQAIIFAPTRIPAVEQGGLIKRKENHPKPTYAEQTQKTQTTHKGKTPHPAKKSSPRQTGRWNFCHT